MIGERNIVEVQVVVVGIEGAPAAVATLQAADPFTPAVDRRLEPLVAKTALRPVHRHDHDGGVIEVGVMRVGILERPSAGTHVRPVGDPVAGQVEHLQGLQPVQSGSGAFDRWLGANLEQRLAHERGVPHRRHAGLAIGFVRLHDQQLLQRGARRHVVGMIVFVAERVVHHDRVGHGGKNRAEPILAVEAFGDESHSLADRAPPRSRREGRRGEA